MRGFQNRINYRIFIVKNGNHTQFFPQFYLAFFLSFLLFFYSFLLLFSFSLFLPSMRPLCPFFVGTINLSISTIWKLLSLAYCSRLSVICNVIGYHSTMLFCYCFCLMLLAEQFQIVCEQPMRRVFVC